MKKNLFSLVVVVVTLSLLLAGCNNPRAESTGVWYNPFSWGDHTLAQSLEKACIGNAVSTVIDGSVYPCPNAKTPEATTVIPTLAPPTAAPVPVVCTDPSIKATAILDGKTLTASGLFLDTNLGKRMTFTSRSLLVPQKAWNDPLSAAELKVVETTYQDIELCVPAGLTARLFAGGYHQHANQSENGVLMNLSAGVYKFSLRNGEVVIWYKDQTEPSSKDLTRIFDQIRNGNFDIHGPLTWFAVSTDILPLAPQDLIKKDQMQIIPALDVEMK